MTKTSFTEKIGGEIIALLRGHQYSGIAVSVTKEGKKFTVHNDPCYAPLTRRMTAAPFGVFYGGHVPEQTNRSSFTNGWKYGYGPEALVWLEHLLDPKGIFAPVLPHLYRTKPEEILEDRGFVFTDPNGPNKGLLWTFIQATRLMLENSSRMPSLLYAREKYPANMATVIALTVRPHGKAPEGGWCPVVSAHGEPLGTQGWKRVGFALAGKLTPRDYHSTISSAQCFGGDITLDYNNPSRTLPLEQWVEKFTEAAKNGTVVTV